MPPITTPLAVHPSLIQQVAANVPPTLPTAIGEAAAEAVAQATGLGPAGTTLAGITGGMLGDMLGNLGRPPGGASAGTVINEIMEDMIEDTMQMILEEENYNHNLIFDVKHTTVQGDKTAQKKHNCCQGCCPTNHRTGQRFYRNCALCDHPTCIMHSQFIDGGREVRCWCCSSPVYFENFYDKPVNQMSQYNKGRGVECGVEART
jgi:hypothetical protein